MEIKIVGERGGYKRTNGKTHARGPCSSISYFFLFPFSNFFFFRQTSLSAAPAPARGGRRMTPAVRSVDGVTLRPILPGAEAAGFHAVVLVLPPFWTNQTDCGHRPPTVTCLPGKVTSHLSSQQHTSKAKSPPSLAHNPQAGKAGRPGRQHSTRSDSPHLQQVLLLLPHRMLQQLLLLLLIILRPFALVAL